jgi:hypothetical protein
MLTCDAYTPGMGQDARGLCPSCEHVRVVRSGRSSEFLMCARSRDDARFPKYPRLPVLRCIGYDQRRAREAAEQSES